MCAWAQRDGADNFALIFTLLQYRDEALTDALTERVSDHGLTVLGRAVAWGHESTVKLVAAACRCPCARPTASTHFSVRVFVAHHQLCACMSCMHCAICNQMLLLVIALKNIACMSVKFPARPAHKCKKGICFCYAYKCLFRMWHAQERGAGTGASFGAPCGPFTLPNATVHCSHVQIPGYPSSAV